MQELKRFPIGVQDFERLRNDGKYYVDKTDLVYKMNYLQKNLTYTYNYMYN